jgi:hypothetical protein
MTLTWWSVLAGFGLFVMVMVFGTLNTRHQTKRAHREASQERARRRFWTDEGDE